MVDYYAILASCAAIRAAYNGHDIPLLLAQFAPEFTLIPAEGATTEGAASAVALQKQARAMFGRYEVYCVESVPYVTQLQGTAWVWGQERFLFVERDTGRRFCECYRVTRVWKQRPDGGWRITFQMHEPDPLGTREWQESGREQDLGIA